MLNEEPSHGYMLRMNHLTFIMFSIVLWRVLSTRELKTKLVCFPSTLFWFSASNCFSRHFPPSILFSFFFPPVKRDFHWNSFSQGPAPMQGQKIIGQPIYPAVLFIFFSPSLHLFPLALDWSWSQQDDSCLLCISNANEFEEKEVELQCAGP